MSNSSCIKMIFIYCGFKFIFRFRNIFKENTSIMFHKTRLITYLLKIFCHIFL